MTWLPPDGISMLVPVHCTVNPGHLRAALSSVRAQTRRPDQIVVVTDGPLGAELEDVLADIVGLERVDLPVHQGAGRALQVGLLACRHTWVARADADDINVPDRLELQMKRLAEQGADVSSAAMLEFLTGEDGGPPRILGVRRCPQEHAEFARRMPVLNPVNHPTAIFRRELALRVGGYQHLPLLEDYDLWARMLAAGGRFTGVKQPLVHFRADGMLRRRTSRMAAASELELQRRLVSYGLVSGRRAKLNYWGRALFRSLPLPALRMVYPLLFRRRVAREQM